MISSELDITFPVLGSQLPSDSLCCTINCNVITKITKSVVTSSRQRKHAKWGTLLVCENCFLVVINGLIMSNFSCHVRNTMMYVLSWQTVYAVTRGLLNALTVHHSSPCIILNVSLNRAMTSQIAKLMGPTWGPPGSCQPQMGPMLAPWTLLSGLHGAYDANPVPVSRLT